MSHKRQRPSEPILIGSGTYAITYLNPLTCAVVKDMDKQDYGPVMRELCTYALSSKMPTNLRKMCGILNMHGFEIDGDRVKMTMDFGGQTLASVQKTMSAERRKDILVKVVRAVCTQLKLGILHGDLKTTNICVDPAGDSVSIIDYGMCQTSISADFPAFESPVHCQTPFFKAPENLMLASRDAPTYTGPLSLVSQSAEVFSLGTVAFSILTNAAPWINCDGAVGIDASILSAFINEVKPPSATAALLKGIGIVPRKPAVSAKTLLDACTVANDDDRDLLWKMMAFSVPDRLGADEVLATMSVMSEDAAFYSSHGVETLPHVAEYWNTEREAWNKAAKRGPDREVGIAYILKNVKNDVYPDQNKRVLLASVELYDNVSSLCDFDGTETLKAAASAFIMFNIILGCAPPACKSIVDHAYKLVKLRGGAFPEVLTPLNLEPALDFEALWPLYVSGNYLDLSLHQRALVDL
jgi:serine/threonine protein kinase